MAFIKEFREFFLREGKVSSGTRQDQELDYPTEYDVLGVKRFNRFLKRHVPSEGVMQKFLESVTFKLNPEDVATETEQGLAVKATDDNAYDRTNVEPSNFTTFTKPSQLPDVVDDSAGDDTTRVIKDKVPFGGDARSVFTVALSTAQKAIIDLNTSKHAEKPYIYFAGADDKDGNGFTLDMTLIYDSTNSIITKPFIALLSVVDFKNPPIAADFINLWFPIGGQGGGFAMIFDVGPPVAQATTIGDVYVNTDDGMFYQADGGLTFQPIFQAQNGNDGASAFMYVGYAQDNIGTGYNPLPGTGRNFVAFRDSTIDLSPIDASTFSGLWLKYVGDDGLPGTSGTVIQHYHQTIIVGAPGVATIAIFADLINAGMPVPDPANIYNFFINTWLQTGPNDYLGKTMIAAGAGSPVVDIDADYNNGVIQANFQTAGTYIVVVKHLTS